LLSNQLANEERPKSNNLLEKSLSFNSPKKIPFVVYEGDWDYGIQAENSCPLLALFNTPLSS
jgi:hypothetical protein